MNYRHMLTEIVLSLGWQTDDEVGFAGDGLTWAGSSDAFEWLWESSGPRMRADD